MSGKLADGDLPFKYPTFATKLLFVGIQLVLLVIILCRREKDRGSKLEG